MTEHSDHGAWRAFALPALLTIALATGLPGARAAEPPADCTDCADDGPSDYTTTNVQEEGVDEPDLMKTDGDYVYVVVDATLHIVDSWPAEEARLLSSLPLSGRGGSLLLAGGRIVAFTRVADAPDEPFTAVRVTVIDVSDRAFPFVAQEFDLDGRLLAARLVDGAVYVVTETERSDLPLLTVTGFDPARGEAPRGASLAADGRAVYGSQDSLYIAQDSRWWFWGRGETQSQTHIHKFALNDGAPTYAAAGAVPGWVLDPFAMSEYQGHLRVATTDTPPRALRPSPEDANNVFVLRQDGGDLGIVGAARGIAPGERISAPRFGAGLAHVSTARAGTGHQLVVDLAAPTDPRLRGELAITGANRYLHPVGDDLLVGIGREGTANGRIGGLAVQLFDVSDPDAPTLLHQHVFSTNGSGWSDSTALRDHHAVTFRESGAILAIPLVLPEDGDETEGFAGLAAYRVGPRSGFEEIGRVSHSGLLSTDCRLCERIRRSILIEGYLYAISRAGMTVSSVARIGTPFAVIPFGR